MIALADRPLSDAQERALIALADLPAWKWTRPGGRWGRTNTLDSLVDRELAARRFKPFYLGGWEYRITDEGRAMLASMGD